eukprot:PITA_29244
MEVKTAFLHGFLKEEVFVEQRQRSEEHDRETHVCRLKKALYGLKQAPRAWYAHIDSYLIKLGFTRSSANPNLYFKTIQGIPLILVLYVDDLFLTGREPLILQCKRGLASEFEMKDLGLMHYFLGLEVWQRPGEIYLSEGKYVVKLLERFAMVECNSADRKSTFGCFFSLGYAMISWMSRKWKLVALSTTEAEYIAASMASCEAVCLRKLFGELFQRVLDTTIIYCDNKSEIRLAKNPVFHDKSKHIEIKYHYIWDMVQRGEVRLHHISTDDQIVDILTKPLSKGKFLVFRKQLGLIDMTLPGGGHS